MLPNNIVLGAGIAGISASYHLKQKGIESTVYEKDSDWGGLCGFFEIDGFRFDRFVHFTFTTDEYILGIFEKSSPLYAHPSISYNYYKGCWLKHPAMSNLASLPTDEKIKIISDFINRPNKDVTDIKNYDEWLRVQNGNYFAENFATVYTRKYWGQEAKNMETKWIGKRIRCADLNEVLKGSYAEQKENFYYTNYMKYPKKGGFRSILDNCRKEVDIKFKKKVCRIDTKNKMVYFADGSQEQYDRLISSLPLPEIVKMIDNCPQDVIKAAQKLNWTCGYQISLGFKRPDVAKHLWFYIYDEDIPPARVYSPNLKSADNAPQGCSSLQAEVFYANDATIPPADEVLEKTIEKLKNICKFDDEDIIVKDIRFEPYANVAFTHGIYENRQIVLHYLISQGIESIGRFCKCDYLWSFQAFESGMRVC
ncbi:MAG: FAD-dependent oxidoreductase [Alphaproteobacteria bacterium]|nr:FAD-dependent oxidoreductase [Alphaproteobacteria bacterium]